MKILVIGCGGNGSWISLVLLQSGHEVVCIDNDKLELSNANRLPVFLVDVVKGLPKIAALKNVASSIGIGERLTVVNDKIDEDSLIEYYIGFKPDVIVDSTDDPNIQMILRRYVEELNVPIILAHYDGYNITIDIVTKSIEKEIKPLPMGYTTPSNVVVPVTVAFFVEKIIREKLWEKVEGEKTLTLSLEPFE